MELLALCTKLSKKLRSTQESALPVHYSSASFTTFAARAGALAAGSPAASALTTSVTSGLASTSSWQEADLPEHVCSFLVKTVGPESPSSLTDMVDEYSHRFESWAHSQSALQPTLQRTRLLTRQAKESFDQVLGNLE